MKTYYAGKTAWITGASSGLGEALSIQLAAAGCRLILSGRRRQTLENLAERCKEAGASGCHILDFDLGSAVETSKALAAFDSINIPLHFLFCNGGVSQRALAHEARLEDDYRIMETNYFSHVRITKHLLPRMIQQGFGHIVVTSSITGKFGFPLRSAYAASKHALHGFYESLQIEQLKGPVRVTIACPGRVNTAISMHAITREGSAHNKMDAGQASGISAHKCAEIMLRATATQKKQIWIGGREILMVWIRQFLPVLFFRIASKIKPT